LVIARGEQRARRPVAEFGEHGCGHGIGGEPAEPRRVAQVRRLADRDPPRRERGGQARSIGNGEE